MGLLKHKVLSEDLYNKLSVLKWDNPHTKRLRLALGDPLVAVAWVPWWELNLNPDLGCWLLGAMRSCTVKKRLNLDGVAHQEDMYVPVGAIKDHDGNPHTMAKALSITDPRVPDYLRSWDKAQQGTAMTFGEMMRHNEAVDKKQRETRLKERAAMYREMRGLAIKDIGGSWFYGSMGGRKKQREDRSASSIVDQHGKPSQQGASA
jgi:hypothetical protein